MSETPTIPPTPEPKKKPAPTPDPKRPKGDDAREPRHDSGTADGTMRYG